MAAPRWPSQIQQPDRSCIMILNQHICCFGLRHTGKGEQVLIMRLLHVLLDLVFMFDFWFFLLSSEPRWVPLGCLLEWLLSLPFLLHIKGHQVIHWQPNNKIKTAEEIRAYTPAQCVQNSFYARLCEKRGTLSTAKRQLKLLMTDQQRSAFLLPRPLTHLIVFQCLKRARHQRCACQSAGSHFQIRLSPLFITDKQTFSSVRRNTRAERMQGGGTFSPLCMRTSLYKRQKKKRRSRRSARQLDSGVKCI